MAYSVERLGGHHGRTTFRQRKKSMEHRLIRMHVYIYMMSVRLRSKFKEHLISGDDWHTAQTQPDSEYHVLPSVGMQLAFFNTVKADYKQLPQ